jgi:hypothetical protein
MMQHFDKHHALKELLTKIQTRLPDRSYGYLRIGLLLTGFFLAIAGSAIFIDSASAQNAGGDQIVRFCSKPTSYITGFLHCQIGDKDNFGWYDKTTPKHVPPISDLRIRNINGNPGSGGKLVIFTPSLYCGGYWDDLIGHGYIEVNGQRFATCPGDPKNLGNGGFNDGATYLYQHAMMRIVTNINVTYGQDVHLKIFGKIYAQTHDDCRRKENGRCVYPGISSCWIYAYSKTTTQDSALARFYRNNRIFGKKKIYDFLTISVADMDLDNYYFDYYDCEDWQMTFAVIP